MSSILKSAAIIIRDRKLLVVRKRGTEIFISPGGKSEGDENEIECLQRELAEELGTSVVSYSYFGTFERPSAFEKESVRISSWIVQVGSELSPSGEIDMMEWVDGSHRARGISIGSVFSECVIPALVKEDFIDG